MLSGNVQTSAGNADHDDDKHAKTWAGRKSAPGPFQKYQDASSILHSALSKAIPKEVFLFVVIVLGAAALHNTLSAGYHTGFRSTVRMASAITEPFGLVMLRQNLRLQNSAAGISGMTMQMYAAVYGIRLWVNLPSSKNPDMWSLLEEWLMAVVSLLLVFDIMRSVFVTHRSSYQHDLDGLKAKYLISACIVLALVLRPDFHFWKNEQWEGFWWSSCLYLDVAALMPQVFMMARGGGTVKAPIAHFVAATFLSRFEDMYDLSYVPVLEGERISLYAVVCLHALHLLLIMDFMFYYMKARFAGSKFSDDVALGPGAEMVSV